MLTLDIASFARRSHNKKIEVGLFTGLTMFCGFLASILSTVDRWWFFALSTAAYVGILCTLFRGSEEEEVKITSIMWFVFVTWSLFPVVWVLAPTGFGILTTVTEATLYIALDLISKVIFGLYISNRGRMMK